MIYAFDQKLRNASKQDQIVNSFHKHECTVIIACGSERGTTMVFAMALHSAILETGIKCYLTEMNDFENFQCMEHLIILTSTYGTGNAPFNAFQFTRKFKAANIKSRFKYAVVGFGSRKFPKFCQYAEKVSFLFKSIESAKEWIPLTKIHERSLPEFNVWLGLLQDHLEGQLTIPFK
ncbi:MAG: flavodoxin family protein [Bacteroidota bacterium]